MREMRFTADGEYVAGGNFNFCSVSRKEVGRE